ncbi:MAG: excinuclease ABC subunit UvrB [Spirochaetes bacterium]|nr:excinuclease ABC subunit UvrB [Spirochaetota bacterium]
MNYKLKSSFKPAYDQQKAIEQIIESFEKGKTKVTLLGVTGSGKTFTCANIIEKLGLPALVISHNKTLSAQLYREFKNFFPENRVEYFVSNFDYYQPEAYLPKRDLYIEKDSSINEEIDRLRLKATEALLSRRDVIIVATVSCIYGIGNPEEFKKQRIHIYKNQKIKINDLLYNLLSIYYQRDDISFVRGKFRLKGDILDIFPAYSKDAIRVFFFSDIIEKIYIIDPLSSNKIEEISEFYLYPANFFVTTPEVRKIAIKQIEEELKIRYDELIKQGKEIEAKRLWSRTMYDLEMLTEVGYVKGSENYSRYFSGRLPGQPPFTLLDYFPEDFLIIIDESHVTIPQLIGMYHGDYSRKKILVEYGFRLPSALDHRPLKFNEVEKYFKKIIFVSATPGEYEKKNSYIIVEQIIRPTGLVDPEIEVRKSEGQMDDLLKEIEGRIKVNERVLVLTLTKENAENLTKFLLKKGVKAKYLHSEIKTLERVEIISDYRNGKFDVLVGINLLREGIDIPEISLVAILDADKVGFLRSEKSLIQMMGRAARNVNGKIIMYCDNVSDSMKVAIEETRRRRKIQLEYNEKYGIIPKSISKEKSEFIEREKIKKEEIKKDVVYEDLLESYNIYNIEDRKKLIKILKDLMEEEAKKWNFENAIFLREKINELKSM